MTSSEQDVCSWNTTLSAHPFHLALEELADILACSVGLWDEAGTTLIGPIAGDPLGRRIMASPRGEVVLAEVHRHVAGLAGGADPAPLVEELARTADHFAIPVTSGSERFGTLTLVTWRSGALPDELLHRLAEGLDLGREDVKAAADKQPARSEAEILKIQKLGALLAALLGHLRAQDCELRHRVDELNAVYNISAMVAGSYNLQEVLDKITRLVCEVMNVKASSLRLLDERTGLLSIKAVYNLSDEYLNKGPVTIEHNPIDAAALAGETVQITDIPGDPRIMYPEQAKREGLASGLVCGLIFRGKPLGVLRVYTSRSHEFSEFEKSLLKAVASQAAAAIVNTRLLAETLEAERNLRQIAYAGEIQRRMIPSSPPCCRRLDIGAVYRPTYRVGGDFYDFIVLPRENLGLATADVSGKGVPASLLMASVRSALRVNAYHMYDVDQIIAEVNRHLCRDTTLGEFATVFYGVLNNPTGRLTYCNAGHDPPMLLRDGQIQYLETGGMAAGIDPNAPYERGWVDLRAGDVLLLYTDGAVEALNFADERFGRGRLADSLRRYVDQPAERIAKNMLWDIRRFRGLAERIDDLSLVVVKVLDEPAPET